MDWRAAAKSINNGFLKQRCLPTNGGKTSKESVQLISCEGSGVEQEPY